MVKKDEGELLKWALSNSSPSSSRNVPVLDEELMEAILGKSEAKCMKECVEYACDTNNTLPDRLSLLDELEMLVESIDNANDVDHMGLWPKIFSLLSSGSDAKIKAAALWIIGTAAQNNPQVQQVILRYNVLDVAFSFLSPTINNEDEDDEVRKKAVYVISSIAKPIDSPGYHAFINFDGITKLSQLREEVNDELCDRIDFLLNFLQSDEPNKEQ